MKLARLACVAGLAILACNPPNAAGPALAPVTTGEAFKGVQCSAVRPKTEPDLMAWDPGERANLEQIRQQGLVVVRYVAKGCNVELQVLSNCDAPGTYAYTPYPSSNSIVVNNLTELFGKLPLGAARFASTLHGDRALRTDYELVGVDAIPIGTVVQRSDLRGDCAGATHVVSKIYVGGFALDAGEKRSIDAAATIFGGGAGAKSSAAVQHLQSEGNPAACQKAMNDGKQEPNCSAPLRIALLPIGGIGHECPSGSHWNGTSCEASQPSCPSGTKWDGSECAAPHCAPGQHFVGGTGCVADARPQRAPVARGSGYSQAQSEYEAAERMPDGPARDKAWHRAAGLYAAALAAAPDAREAPEATMNAAYADKKVGEYDSAIEMYKQFLSRYGSERELAALRKTGKNSQYHERVRYLRQSEDALASGYVLFFEYPEAAAMFEKISETAEFPEKQRLYGARNALTIHWSLGDQSAVERDRTLLRKLGASAQEMAEAGFRAAGGDPAAEYVPTSAQRGSESAMTAYYLRNRSNDTAARYVVRAAYVVARIKRAAGSAGQNEWWRRTISAFARYERLAPRAHGRSEALGSAEASMAAEGEYRMLDEQLAASFDYRTGHHHYRGSAHHVLDTYRKDFRAAGQWKAKLQHTIDTYVSPVWTAAAVARQGSLYDSLRRGLYNARPTGLGADNAVSALEAAAVASSSEQADAARVKAIQWWRYNRDKAIDTSDAIMINRYGTAVMLGRRYNLDNPEVTQARRRLAYYEDVIGGRRLAKYAAQVKDPSYVPRLFQMVYPGMAEAGRPRILPPPLPVLVR